jgi:hypothetical protein|tara:strand:+ start:104 stop:205 length:102 start_codon:yes stop_codon:yes gene_type:complete
MEAIRNAKHKTQRKHGGRKGEDEEEEVTLTLTL